MRTLRRILIALLLAIAFAVIAGFLVANANVGVGVRITGNYAHILNVECVDGSYALTGMLFTCDSVPFDIRGVTLRLDDTVFAKLGGRSLSRPMDSDSICYAEQFVSPVHGGVLRRWINAKGKAVMVVRGVRYAMRFVIPAQVRAKIKAVFWKTEKSGSKQASQ